MKNIALGSFVGLFLLLSASYMPTFVIYNTSPSIPVGFYRLYRSRKPSVGDIIAFTILSNSRQQILKAVAATKDDFVCSKNNEIRINGAIAAMVLSEDSRYRPLPKTHICRKLAKDEYFVLSSHPRSFDSRYFGPIEREHIRGVVRPIWTDGGEISFDKESEGKIKESMVRYEKHRDFLTKTCMVFNGTMAKASNSASVSGVPSLNLKTYDYSSSCTWF